MPSTCRPWPWWGQLWIVLRRRSATWQRTDVLEVEEHFAKGSEGQFRHAPQAQPPSRSERISGLARLLRGYAMAALENMPLWHERDISHSSAERVLLPDCSITLHFMLREMTDVVAGLVVYPETMLRNMTIYGGVIFSQQVMLALVGCWSQP